LAFETKTRSSQEKAAQKEVIMNIPNQIKLAGYNYTIEMVRHLARDRDSAGESSWNGQKISIDESLSQTCKEAVLIHEVIEQINVLYDLNLEHEKIVVLETALHQFIRDNPGILIDKKA
jgi:hypothetical protein